MRALPLVLGFSALLMSGSPASAQSNKLDVTFDTTTLGQEYTPANALVVWVEDAGGAFVKTISRYASIRSVHLLTWIGMAGPNDVDAVTGPTRINHESPALAHWDLTDALGNEVPDGIYTIRVEIVESNVADGEGTASLAEFSFNKDGILRDELATPLGDNVLNVQLSYNNIPSAEECALADGICLDTCGASDPDCDQGAGPGDGGEDPGPSPTGGETTVGSGCSTGSAGGSSLALLILLGAVLVRRKR